MVLFYTIHIHICLCHTNKYSLKTLYTRSDCIPWLRRFATPYIYLWFSKESLGEAKIARKFFLFCSQIKIFCPSCVSVALVLDLILNSVEYCMGRYMHAYMQKILYCYCLLFSLDPGLVSTCAQKFLSECQCMYMKARILCILT